VSPAAPTPPESQPAFRFTCDVLVVGAGLGGCAAALRAARMGRRVCLIDENGWPGGQITSQGVPTLDEHPYIETFGGTSSYYELRNGVRAYYRKQYTLAPSADTATFNPGNAWVSTLSFEPRVGAAVLEAMMAGPHDSGELQVFYYTRAVFADVSDGRVVTVMTQNLENGTFIEFRPAFVLDATDLGDMFVLTSTDYAVGQESRAETGEPSAPDAPDPACLQNFTFPFAVEYRPGEDHTIPKPEGYEQNRDAQPYTLIYRAYDLAAPAYRMFETAPGTLGPFWTYRRVLDAANFGDPRVAHDISIINWSSNDFRGGSTVDRPPDEQTARCQQARLLSLGFLYWLQTEAPRDDGGSGYPELRPRPDVMGTADGLSQRPYVREGRRLRARATIVEQQISAASHLESRAARFPDSVGIGFYPIDLHGCGSRTTDIDTKPFQIPLGALVPVRTTNLLPAAKNIGTTHLTNGAYRLHPGEWAVGDAAAATAAFCLRAGVTPQTLHDSPDLVRRLQLLLVDQRIPVYWYDDVPLAHPAFAATQLLAVEGVWEGNDADLHFSPDDPALAGEAKRVVAAAVASIRRRRGTAAADQQTTALQPESSDALPLTWAAAATLVTPRVPGAVVPDRAAEVWSQPIARGELAIWIASLVRAAIEGQAR